MEEIYILTTFKEVYNEFTDFYNDFEIIGVYNSLEKAKEVMNENVENDLENGNEISVRQDMYVGLCNSSYETQYVIYQREVM